MVPPTTVRHAAVNHVARKNFFCETRSEVVQYREMVDPSTNFTVG